MDVTRDPDEEPQPKVGIKFSWITDEFIPEHGGWDAFEGLLTREVKEKFIQPKTKEKLESYCEYLERNGNTTAWKPSATAFLSHAHSYKFLDTIRALQTKLAKDKYIFFDIFCINQHRSLWSYEFLSTTFMTSIKSFGRTVVVMSPWNNPLPFTRAWCIYEAYCTAISGNKYDIALSVEEKASFMNSLLQKDMSVVMDEMLATIDASKSEAYHPEERDRIHSIIESSIGFDRLNAIVLDQYREWTLQTSLEILESMKKEHSLQPSLHYIVGYLYTKQGNNSEAIRHLTNAMDLSIEIGGKYGRDTGRFANLLALTYMDIGDYNKAISLLDDLIDKSKEINGEQHDDTVSSLCNLATAYDQKGDHEKALPIYLECLELQKVTIGENNPKTLDTMVNIGIVYRSLGETEKALRLHSEGLSRRMELFGENHPSTLGAMYILAGTIEKLGGLRDALSLYSTCWAKRRVVLGENHPDTLTAMQCVAGSYSKVGENEKALPIMSMALERSRKHIGENAIKTLDIMHALANVYSGLGQYDTSADIGFECVEKRKIALGERHPQTLESLNNLAAAYKSRRDLDKAITAWKECFESRKEVLGEDHPMTLKCQNSLGMAYDERGDISRGDLDNAKQLLSDCLEKMKRVMGMNDKLTILCMMSLGGVHKKNQDWETAVPLYVESIDHFERVIGTNHIVTMKAMEDLLEVYTSIGDDKKTSSLRSTYMERKQKIENEDSVNSMNQKASQLFSNGAYDEALSLFQECFDKAKGLWGEDDARTLNFLNNVGVVYKIMGNIDEALPIYEQCLEKRKGLFGENDAVTLESMNNLALLYDATGDYERAIALHTKCLEKRSTVLGRNHNESQRSMQNLGTAYSNSGDYSMALKVYTELVEILETLGQQDPKVLENVKALEKMVLRQQLPSFEFLQGKEILISTDSGGVLPAEDLVARLGEDGVLGLYFSASHHPAFTSELLSCYEELKSMGKSFEIVFISLDQSIEAWKEYYSSMTTAGGEQWLALNYEDRKFAQMLSAAFELNDIPTLAMVRQDGTVLSNDAVEHVQNYGVGSFPWDEDSIKAAQKPVEHPGNALLEMMISNPSFMMQVLSATDDDVPGLVKQLTQGYPAQPSMEEEESSNEEDEDDYEEDEVGEDSEADEDEGEQPSKEEEESSQEEDEDDYEEDEVGEDSGADEDEGEEEVPDGNGS